MPGARVTGTCPHAGEEDSGLCANRPPEVLRGSQDILGLGLDEPRDRRYVRKMHISYQL